MSLESPPSGAVAAPAAAAVDPAFARLYQDQFRRISGVVQSLVGRRDIAEELTQEAFVIAHDRWSRVGGYERPQDFVRRVALNRAVSSLRRRGAERRALARLGPPSDEVAATDRIDAPLWSHVRRLPARQAQAIALVYVEDLSVDEVAAVLDISPSSVKTHLQRARSTLAEAMAPERRDVQPEGDRA